eukprot:2251471-Rhodomonas_salina.5
MEVAEFLSPCGPPRSVEAKVLRAELFPVQQNNTLEAHSAGPHCALPTGRRDARAGKLPERGKGGPQTRSASTFLALCVEEGRLSEDVDSGAGFCSYGVDPFLVLYHHTLSEVEWLPYDHTLHTVSGSTSATFVFH